MSDKDTVSKQIKKGDDHKTFKRKIFLVIILVISIVSFSMSTLWFYLELEREKGYSKIIKITNSNFVKKIEDLKKKKDSALVVIEQLEAKRQEAYAEIEVIKARVEKIKTLDDLLQRDIKLYIKAHYRKVPTSVAGHISEHIIKSSKKYNIPPILLVGIIQVESGFNPMITGVKTKYGHARGLMQVMPEWVKKMGLKTYYDLYDIDKNIDAGCRVFNIHLEEGKGKISEGLYRYVNQDKKYVTNVFTAMGKFVAFRSTVKTGKEGDAVSDANGNGKEYNEPSKRTEDSTKRGAKSVKQ